MPIRPEMRALYPPDWPAISLRIRTERAEGRCECVGECGRHDGPDRCTAVNGEPHPVTRSKVVLTVAHLNHQPADCRGCHEGPRPCDCHITGAEAREVIRNLRDRVEHAEDRLAAFGDGPSWKTLWREFEATSKRMTELTEQVAEALALCTEIRPDSVLGTSPEVRLGLVRDRLAMQAGEPDAR